jgi:glycosyltransferase involved in cell wall biosynthesis
VLFAGSATELGGAETALLSLLRHLSRERVQPSYASLEFGDGPMPERVEELGVSVHRLPRGRLRQVGRTAEKIRALARVLRDEEIDVVVSNSGHPLVVARPASWLARRPCAWWVHLYDPSDLLRGEWLALAQQWLGADVLFANSEYTARLLRANFPKCPPVKILRPGVDLRAFRPDSLAGARVRDKLAIGAQTPLVGIFGRVQPWKGQHVFLEAAARVVPRFPECRFVLVGGSLFGLDEEYAKELRARADRPDLRGRVIFAGHREDTNALMNACDVVVHASVKPEPWGLVVAEAMAAGRAVVAAAAGGPLEMIDPGNTGLLTPPGDASALAMAIETLLADPARRDLIGKAARIHAAARFDARICAEEFCAAMEALAGKTH